MAIDRNVVVPISKHGHEDRRVLPMKFIHNTYKMYLGKAHNCLHKLPSSTGNDAHSN